MNASPQNIFLLVWLFPIAAPYLLASDLILHVSSTTKFIVIFNVLAFYYMALIAWLAGWLRNGTSARKALGRIDYLKFNKKIIALFYLWLALYFLNILGSGGIPLYWVLTGDTRTYADFGLPTLGGLSNMLRAFILTSCYIVYFYSGLSKAKRNRFLLIGIFLLFSAFALETGRGNGVVLLLHPLGLHLLINKISIGNFLKWIVFAILFILGLSGIQILRYGGDIETLEKYAENSGMGNFEGISLLVVPAITYTAIPIINTDLNVLYAPLLKFSPNYSLQGIMPTILRDRLYEKQDYGELINEGNNVTSFYVPLLRDFGILGCVVVVIFIQLAVFYFYVKARLGNPFFVLSWPPIFMSLTLSFFSLFFTSLIVVLYPILVAYVLKGCLLHKERAARSRLSI